MNPIIDVCEAVAELEAVLPKTKITESKDHASQVLAQSFLKNIVNLPENEWVDITREFFDSCIELKVGEVAINVENGLVVGMSDVELIEPDIDITRAVSKQEDLMDTFQSAVECGMLKLNNFTPAELIGTFDALFSCLVSWLEGDSMDHGLFTCLYLHANSEIEDKAMSSFCHAIRCIIGQIQNVIEMADVYVEEDFEMYGSFQMKSFEDSIPTTINAMIEDAENEWLHPSKYTRTYPIEDCLAVVNRLHFMRNFYDIIFKFEMFMLSAVGDSFIRDLMYVLHESMDLVPQIAYTIYKGTPAQPEFDLINSVGFSPRNPKRCAPTSTYLMERLCDREGAIDFLDELLHRLKHACKVIHMEDLYSTLDFCIDFSSRSQICILSRSVLQGLFLNEKKQVFGQLPLKEFLIYSAHAFSAPRILDQQHPLYAELKIHIESFFDYILETGSLLELILICGFNNQLQRAVLADILKSFDQLQEKALALDSVLLDKALKKEAEGQYVFAADLRQGSLFSIWVLFNTLRSINLYLATGFDLEIYAVSEFLFIYWYAYDCLFASMARVLKRAQNNLIEDVKYTNTKNKFIAFMNSKKSKFKKFRNPTIKVFGVDIAYYQGLCNMAGGMFKALVGLTKDGRIHSTKSYNEEFRFNQRFKPLEKLICPKPVTYADYKQVYNAMIYPRSSKIYNDAAVFFDQACKNLALIKKPRSDILDLIATAKNNFVAMSILSKGYQKGTKVQPDFRFSVNSFFPMIKLK